MQRLFLEQEWRDSRVAPCLAGHSHITQFWFQSRYIHSSALVQRPSTLSILQGDPTGCRPINRLTSPPDADNSSIYFSDKQATFQPLSKNVARGEETSCAIQIESWQHNRPHQNPISCSSSSSSSSSSLPPSFDPRVLFT